MNPQQHIRKVCLTFMRRFLLAGIVSSLLVACGGGGGGNDGGGTSPTISNLNFTPTVAFLNDGGGTVTVYGTINFADPDGDIVSYVLTIYDSNGSVVQTLSDTIPGIEGITAGSGHIYVGANTTVIDDYTVRVYLIDSKDNPSNTLSGTFSVVGPKQVTSALPDTGIDRCYNQDIAINCPLSESEPFYGQDFHYSSHPMSFANNGDGTITDNVTSLMWQMAPDGQAYNWYKATGTFDAVNNPTAFNVCSNLTLGGHTDWRLPEKRELQSIVDYGVVNPAIDTDYFSNTGPSAYWADTEYDSTDAWYVQFADGAVMTDGKTTDKNVQCVRGTVWGSNDFVDNGDGTVTDNDSGLMWQKTGQGSGNEWQEMLGVCTGLDLAGHSDWRLPDIKELATIADAAASLVMPSSALYCSATTIVDETDSVWVMMFSPTNPSYVNGEIFRFGAGNSKYFCGSFYSRCVR